MGKGGNEDVQGGGAYGKAAGLLRELDEVPELVVVDLDYTLWKCYVECFKPSDTPPVYPDALPILAACKARGIQLAVASKSPATDTAKTWLRKLGIDSHFKAIEVFGAAGKAQHFKKIKEKTGVAYSNMLFFDDEHPNIKFISSIGVTSIYVPDNGLDMAAFEKGLQQYSSQRQSDKGF